MYGSSFSGQASELVVSIGDSVGSIDGFLIERGVLAIFASQRD